MNVEGATVDAPTLTPLAQHIGVAITDVTAADLNRTTLVGEEEVA